MALTDAQICNMALSRIGQKQLLADLAADTSQQAACCNAVYLPCRLELLEAADWGFARKHAVLAVAADINGNPIVRSGWAVAYAAPNDMLVPRTIFNGIRAGGSIPAGATNLNPFYGTNFVSDLASPPSQPFEVESSDDGQTLLILCDLDSAELIYTSNAVSNANFTSTFINAFAWRLAMELALSLPIKGALATAAAQQYEMALKRAKALSLRTRQDDDQPQSQFITSRS